MLFWLLLIGAWHSITLAGQQRLLHPLLVTGLKVWHLRPDSCCSQKHQFWAAVSQLPKDSEVVLLLGEIDCREGMVTAVEKMKVRDAPIQFQGVCVIPVLLQASAAGCSLKARLWPLTPAS
jgi:hypothetical protein